NAAPSRGDANVSVNAIKVWDTNTGRLIRNLIGHKDEVVALTFSPDERRIISASMDRTIRIWDAGNGSSLATTIVGRNGEWVTVYLALVEAGVALLGMANCHAEAG